MVNALQLRKHKCRLQLGTVHTRKTHYAELNSRNEIAGNNENHLHTRASRTRMHFARSHIDHIRFQSTFITLWKWMEK